MTATSFQDFTLADADRDWESHLAKYCRKMDRTPPWERLRRRL